MLLLLTSSVVGADTTVNVLPTAGDRLSSARAKPSAVEWLMTGDYMTKLRWRHWGRRRASAAGSYYLNRCEPSCGGGSYKKMRGKLTLSHVVTCRGVRLYTAATARYYSRGRWHKAAALGEPANPCSP
jgi:hypothetical protein